MFIPPTKFLESFLVGALVGFLSGLFGKGGSAVTTPILHAFVGIPSLLALATPLPATIPTTLAALYAYRKQHWLSRDVILWTSAFGIVFTVIGSMLTEFFGGKTLMLATAVFVGFVGSTFLINPTTEHPRPPVRGRARVIRAIVVGTGVGFVSGLLANSGGILFAPLFVQYLHLDLKESFVDSLVVSALLALPGTLVHWYLGHIDWWLVLALAVGSIPLSYLGARVAIWAKTSVLERAYGIALVIFGFYFLIVMFNS
jgi:uncharacterized membrane protein YfcA